MRSGQGKSPGKPRKTIKNLKHYIPLYIMLLPAVIYVAINNYAPMGDIILAFKEFNAKKGIYGSDFVGLSNFTFLLKNKDLGIILRNTIGYNVAFIIVNLIVGVTLAILITEIRNLKIRKIYQSVILFPFVVSIIIISYMVRGFLDASAGQINHLFKTNVSWYDVKWPWPFIIIFVNTWKGVGYGTVLYIAAILGVDTSLYESAALDGATRLQQIRYITLPFLKPTMITVTLLAIGRIFNSDFGLFYQVPQQSGLITSVTQTIDTFVYKALTAMNRVGMSAAATFFQSVIGLILILIFNGIVRKISRDNALF